MPGVKKRKRPCSDDDPEVSFNNNQRKRLKLEIDGDQKPASELAKLPRKSPNGYLLPDPLPAGLILTDLRGYRWVIGRSVGLGGFGEIYSASKVDAGGPDDAKDFVVKVEPHTNGPLFVETHFYLRCADEEAIGKYKNERGLEHLGVPHLEGSGSFWFNGKKFRFLVIPRYGTDLQTLLDESGSVLTVDTACQMAVQIVDSYEYIHSLGYVHKDVKGSNLLFETTSAGRRMYLVDYGLASKYLNCGIHKPFTRDERSAHEGTLEYNSRDSHLGCFSRRGDIEVLFYNLVDWMGGKLPWDKTHFVKPEIVEEGKLQAFSDCRQFLKSAFKNEEYPDVLLKMMEYVKSLEFEDRPDYDYLKSLLRSGHDTSLDSSMEEVSLSMEITRRHPVKVPSPVMVRKPVRRSLRNAKLPLDQQSAESDGNDLMRSKKSKESKNRFAKEFENHVQKKLVESMRNPTPTMEIRIKKIAERDAFKSSPNGHCRSESRSPARITDKKGNCSKSQMLNTPKKLSRSKSECGLQSQPKSQIGGDDSHRLLRSQRRLSDVDVESTKRSSFRQNLRHFFASVTRSILRMPNQN